MAGIINKETLKNKQEMLADIFALKAGMGMLYDLDSQKKAVKKEIEKVSLPITNQENLVLDLKDGSDYDLKRSKFNEFNADYYARDLKIPNIKEATKNYFKLRLDDVTSKISFIFSQIFVYLFIYALTLAGLGVAYVLNKELVTNTLFIGFFKTNNLALILGAYFSLISLGIMGVIYGLIYGCYALIYTIRIKIMSKRRYSYLKSKSYKEKSSSKRAKEDSEAKAKQYLIEKTKLESIERKLAPTIDSLNAEVKRIDDLGKGLFLILQDTFAPYIAVDDWKNIDYIIYLISTSRADNIKEALNYIDNQERFEELLDKIEEVGENIQRSISNSFNLIRESVNDSVSRLSSQITSYNEELESQNDEYISTQREKNKLLDDLNDETKVQNDLLKQLNKSSGMRNYW